MTLHFSDQIHVRDAVVSVDSQVKRLFERLFRGFGNRREENDVQTVPSRFQQFLHVDPEPPEHVARGRGLLPVDKDVGKGVKRVDVQVDGLFAQKFGEMENSFENVQSSSRTHWTSSSFRPR